MGSIISKRKIFLSDSYAVVIWSALPAILFIPLGMILSRIIENDAYVIPIFIFIIVEVIWILYRLLKGIAIVYDVGMRRVYLAVLILLIIFGGSFIIYNNLENSTIAYMKFILKMIESSNI
jgi:hypothetical protein